MSESKSTRFSPEHTAWRHMRERCTNPRHPSWARYGGRGITVCDRWMRSYEAFVDDMGPRPSPDHSLERVDNNKGYSPDNCVWATRAAQAANRETTAFHTVNGVTHTQTEWARLRGIPQCTISLRLKRGWTAEDALTRLPARGEKTPPIEFRGETHSLYEWAKITGIDYRALHTRYRRGWSVDRMLTMPVQTKRKARCTPKRTS